MLFNGLVFEMVLSLLDILIVLLVVCLTTRTGFAIAGLLAMPIYNIIISYIEVLEHVTYLGSPYWASHFIAVFFLVGVSIYYIAAGIFLLKATNILIYFFFASLVLCAHRYIADFLPQFSLLQYTLLGWFSSAIESLVLIGFHFLISRRISNCPLDKWWRE